MRIVLSLMVSVFMAAASLAQQEQSSQDKATENPKQAASKEKKPKKEQPTPAPAMPETKASESANKPGEPTKPDSAEATDKDKDEHYDVTEIPPVVTHHQIAVNGKTLSYTATAGRLPIKRADGKIEAEMFFVAYTLDWQDVSRRSLTFAFNGGPGSASIWLHMGALGPRRVALPPDGFLPPAPYKVEDNPHTLLDKSDLVLVDAIGTGFSRGETAEVSKKFWGVKGDIEAFSEFIRMYISRYERWTSPLFLLGESYGTTRSAGIAGNLAEQGITFNGITLLSMVLNF